MGRSVREGSPEPYGMIGCFLWMFVNFFIDISLILRSQGGSQSIRFEISSLWIRCSCIFFPQNMVTFLLPPMCKELKNIFGFPQEPQFWARPGPIFPPGALQGPNFGPG